MTFVKLNIRPAEAGDRDGLYRMICSLENKLMNEADFDLVLERNLASDLVGYFIAEADGRPIGMGSCHIQSLLHHAAYVAEIQEMFVDAEFRSLKIGHAIMEVLVDFAKSKGAVQLEVTSRNFRAEAHRFYQKEDFEKSHVKLVRYFS